MLKRTVESGNSLSRLAALFMDGTTEPVIAVIGHPIAGNPAQFAIERALLSMQLQWRVMSFDVPPERVGAALDGLETLAFRGVLIDPSLADAANRWYRSRAVEGESDAEVESDTAGEFERYTSPIGCLFRDPEDDDRFVGDSAATTWIADFIAEVSSDHPIERAIWLGDEMSVFPEESVEFEARSARKKVTNPESLSTYDLVVISTGDDQPLDLRMDDWVRSDGGTWVIDMTEGHPEQGRIERLGYQLLDAEKILIGMICESMRHWTGTKPDGDIVQEAIEEYLAV